MSNATSKSIFVVGCPRSGTSLFAKLLTMAGLKTIDSSKKNPEYPSGYYEYLPIQMFNKAIERLPRGANYRITIEPFLKSDYLADEFIATMFSSAWEPVLNRKIDFVKFPQLALSVDFLFEQFSDIHIIALWRDPVRTFRSLVIKEFGRTMIPASGPLAILLWNMYAYQLVKAKEKWPDSVTVFNIDDLVENDKNVTPLLRQLGYEPVQECTLFQCLQPGVWTQRVALPWHLYFQIMRLSLLAIKRWLPVEKKILADPTLWRNRLCAVTDTL